MAISLNTELSIIFNSLNTSTELLPSRVNVNIRKTGKHVAYKQNLTGCHGMFTFFTCYTVYVKPFHSFVVYDVLLRQKVTKNNFQIQISSFLIQVANSKYYEWKNLI